MLTAIIIFNNYNIYKNHIQNKRCKNTCCIYNKFLLYLKKLK